MGVSKRVLLMASRESHCLADLLYRFHLKELFYDIPCMVSSHDDLRIMVEWHDIPYHHVPMDKESKQTKMYCHVVCAGIWKIGY